MVPGALVVVGVLLPAVGSGPGIHSGDVDQLCGADNEWANEGRSGSCDEGDSIRTKAEADVSGSESAPEPEGPGEGVRLGRIIVMPGAHAQPGWAVLTKWAEPMCHVAFWWSLLAASVALKAMIGMPSMIKVSFAGNSASIQR